MQGPTELMCKNVLFPGDPQMPGKRHITPSDPWDCHLPSPTGREGDCPQLPGHPSLVPPRPWRHLATWQDRVVGPPPGSEQGFWPSQLPGGQEGQVCTLVPDGPRGQRALEGPRHLALRSQAEHISNSAASWVGGGRVLLSCGAQFASTLMGGRCTRPTLAVQWAELVAKPGPVLSGTQAAGEHQGQHPWQTRP